MKALLVLAALLLGVVLSTPVWADPRPHADHRRPVPVDARHVERHATMTEQMRAMGVDHRMHDGSWGLMREPLHVANEEHHHASIDRMLGRPSR
jgi:hypothetical protein